MIDRSLHPAIQPYESFHLDVGDGHRLYVECSGNPAGRPIVVLHGGPGAGTVPIHRRYFDPAVYRIILFDQRGAGRSEPLGCLVHNDTAHLIADIERVRERLGVSRWAVFGGSWGSTLALAYAGLHVARIAGLILRGVWLGRNEDIDWLFDGLRRLVPDHWDQFAAQIPEAERDEIIEAFWRRLDLSDPAASLAAARAWCAFEKHCATLLPDATPSGRSNEQQHALAKVEAHYFRNSCFLEPGAVLAAAMALSAVPGIIVHGRYDLLAPIEGAYLLVKAWPTAELHIVDDAGHSIAEPGIQAQLLAATDHFATLPPWK